MEKEQNYYKNTYHHLYNRGANKDLIFYEKENYLYFLRRTKFYSQKYKIKIFSYCLMPNHFHIFLKQTKDELAFGVILQYYYIIIIELIRISLKIYKLILLVFLITQSFIYSQQDNDNGYITIIPGEQFSASGFYELWFGVHWREVWTTPVKVEILNLDEFAGGLTPIEKGGGFWFSINDRAINISLNIAKSPETLRLYISAGQMF